MKYKDQSYSVTHDSINYIRTLEWNCTSSSVTQLSRVDDGVNEPQNVAILLLLPPSTNNEIVNYL